MRWPQAFKLENYFPPRSLVISCNTVNMCNAEPTCVESIQTIFCLPVASQSAFAAVGGMMSSRLAEDHSQMLLSEQPGIRERVHRIDQLLDRRLPTKQFSQRLKPLGHRMIVERIDQPAAAQYEANVLDERFVGGCNRTDETSKACAD